VIFKLIARTLLLFFCFIAFHHAQADDLSPTAQELMALDFFTEGKGMHLSPGILNKLDLVRNVIEGSCVDETLLNTLMHRWGIQEYEGNLVGIKTVRYQGLHIGVLGCVACHSGKAAGQYIVGIGNKNIDPGQIGIDGVMIEKEFKRVSDALVSTYLMKKSSTYRDLENSSIKLMEKLKDPRMSADTQGLVPVSLVGSWFYEMAEAPLPNNGFKGAVKVPSWFGFEKKLEVGQFADAIGKGHPPGWIIGVEITSGQSAQGVRDYFSRVEHASALISQLKPPKYPFPIQFERALRGKKTFEQTCAHCHGTYEYQADGSPIFKAPKVIPWEKVGTDTDRLDYVTPDFLDKVAKSPLKDLIQLSEYAGKRMYVAPRLHAIWARFPYLHNASVPTLRDLLEPASKRPKAFSLKNAGEKERFDPVRMGLTLDTKEESLQAQLAHAKKNGTPDRSIYDTSILGQSNQGHEKFVDLSNTDKDDLIEYLKTL
jgi:hypothetical protein